MTGMNALPWPIPVPSLLWSRRRHFSRKWLWGAVVVVLKCTPPLVEFLLGAETRQLDTALSGQYPNRPVVILATVFDTQQSLGNLGNGPRSLVFGIRLALVADD
jgi:hypothetical protein